MDIQPKARERTLLYWITGIFLLLSLIRTGILFVEFHELDTILNDFHWRWQECAYLLKGIYPMDVIYHRVPVDPGIGPLSPIAGTVPWAYVMGNLFVFGFIPYSVAQILGLVIYPLVAVATCTVIYRYVSERMDRAYAFLAVFLVLIDPYWPYSYIKVGNYGTMCAYFLVMMLMLLDRRPVLSGVLLALASLKPQLAFLFYVALFFQGRWKTLSTASSIVLVSWGVASLLTGVSPIVMLLEMFEQGANYCANSNGAISSLNGSYYGLFTFLANAGSLTVSECLLVSGIFGIVVVAVLSILFIKTDLLKGNELLYFSIPAVVSNVWSYSLPIHRTITMLLVMAYLVCIHRSLLTLKMRVLFIFGIVSIYFLNGDGIPYKVNKMLLFITEKTGISLLEDLIWFNNFFLYYSIWGFLLALAIVIAWRQKRAGMKHI